MTYKQFKAKLLSPLLWGNFLAMAIVGVLLLVGALWFLNSYTRHGDAVTTPDVVGLSEEAAMNRLAEAGLRGEVSDTGYVSEQPAGTILGQSIAAGNEVKTGRLIHLSLNSHKPRMVTLPDIVGNASRREAEMRLTALGFRLGEPEMVEGDRDWVIDMKVNGGPVRADRRAASGSVVTLTIGKGLGDEELYDDVFPGSDSLYNDYTAGEGMEDF